MDVFRWPHKLNKKLIILYKQHENLYEPDHPDYLNKAKRAESFNEIYDELSKYSSGLSIDAIKKKAHTVRSQFMKEYRKVLTSQRKGCTSTYKPTLWYYPYLDFLKGIARRKFELDNNISSRTDDQLDDSSSSVISNDLECIPQTRKEEDGSSSINLLHTQVTELNELLVNRTEKEYDWLGKQVVSELNKIESDSIKEDTAWAIQSIIRDHIQKDRSLRKRKNSDTGDTPVSKNTIPAVKRANIRVRKLGVNGW